MSVRSGFSPVAQLLLNEPFSLRFLPALVALPAQSPLLQQHEADMRVRGFSQRSFRPPDDLRPDVRRPVDWEALRLMIREERCLDVLQRSLAEAGTSGDALRALSQQAVAAAKAARLNDGGHDIAKLEEDAAALDTSASALACRVRAPLVGRVAFTLYNRSEYLLTDLDPIRSASSHMPRRSKRDAIRSFGDYLDQRWGVTLSDGSQPLLAVGNTLCGRCCLVDLSDDSARDRFTGVEPGAAAPREQQRHHTFLVPETLVLTGVTAECSAEHSASMLAELAWNVAVGQRLHELERRLGYTFKEKSLLREALTHEAYANAIEILC